jgi:hypothetical protein
MRVVLMLRSRLIAYVTALFRRLMGRTLSEEARAAAEATPSAEAAQARPGLCPVDERDVIVPKKRAIRHIIIGVDFGTSTTKVIWQDLSDNHFEAVRWHPDKDGLGQWLLPSTVLLRNDKVCFGVPEREEEQHGLCLRSLKLCLLCRRKPPVCRCGNPGAQGGSIRLSEAHYDLPASAFAGLFLAYVFCQVERRLLERFPNDQLVLLWNIGCPMDYTDADGYRCDWEKLAGTAMELRTLASGDVKMSLLDEFARHLERFDVPPEEERNYFVQPEGLAAVKAFLESPDAEMKTYAIVDVGAGTTEVSFFFNGKAMAEPGQPFRPSYLADSTEAVGGVRIDQELAEEWGCSTEEARRRKERSPDKIPLIQSLAMIHQQYRKTCARIAKQDSGAPPHNRPFDLFIIGGGSRLPAIRAQLNDSELPGRFIKQQTLELRPPKTRSAEFPSDADYHLFAVACGLASSLDWAYFPSVDPSPPIPTATRVDVDEWYPK